MEGRGRRGGLELEQGGPHQHEARRLRDDKQPEQHPRAVALQQRAKLFEVCGDAGVVAVFVVGCEVPAGLDGGGVAGAGAGGAAPEALVEKLLADRLAQRRGRWLFLACVRACKRLGDAGSSTDVSGALLQQVGSGLPYMARSVNLT